MSFDNAAAVAVVGFATITVWESWQKTAPTLAELRGTSKDKSDANNVAARQKLYDAELTIGSLVVIAGGSLAIVTKDYRIFALMVATFTLLAVWYHSILAGTPNNVRIN
jgi:hypothetical protein